MHWFIQIGNRAINLSLVTDIEWGKIALTDPLSGEETVAPVVRVFLGVLNSSSGVQKVITFRGVEYEEFCRQWAEVRNE